MLAGEPLCQAFSPGRDHANDDSVTAPGDGTELERLRLSLNDRYQILDEIGRGGMAVVYRAHDLRHNRDVALKVLSSSTGAPIDPARFAREIRIAAGLSHPGIVPVFDSGGMDDILFYVMPLIRGESLRARMSRRPALTAAESCALLAEVADALDAAHRAGIVHRDVKPENILIAAGHPLVTDFGIARATMEQGESLTRTGTVIGTALYMSPEQLEAAVDIDGRADVFAAGCILFEILTGAPPFAAPTLPGTLARLATEEAPLLPATVTASRGLRAVLAKALAREPANRYPTAEAFAVALRGVDHEARATTRSTPRRRVQRAIALLAGAAVVVLAAAFVVTRRHATASVPSVAVLPFVNASADTSLGYVSDGMTEELQTALGNAGIAVASREVSFAWRGRSPTPQQVADSLRVDNVLESSVRQTADSLRITSRLLDGKSMLVRKTFSVTRKRSDVFALEEEVAQAIVAALRPTIIGAPTDTLVRDRTMNLAAYDLTLRAKALNRGATGTAAAGSTGERTRRALVLVDSAIVLDSSYAPAWALRALELQNQSIFGDVPGFDPLPLARDAAARALRLDDRDAESQASYGSLLFRYDWDWAGAEQHLRRAIAINPRLSAAHGAYGRFLRSMGRFAEARAELPATYAAAASPRAEHLAAARISYFARDYARGIKETLSGVDTTTRTYPTWTAQLYIAAGDFVSAEAILNRPNGKAVAGEQVTRALLYAHTGRAREARLLLDSLGTGSDVDLVREAGTYAVLGDTARALGVLERAIGDHDALVVDFKVDPTLDGLRATPRFKEMMRRLSFP
jgi:serine/threonine protein kinase/tetratricopeptide (TPR) repeat protein